MKNLKLTLLSFFATLFFAASVSSQTNGVVVYNDHNFQGANMTLTESWSGGRGFDRIVKSIRVPAGYRVRMYDKKNFKGGETMITEDWNPGAGAWWTTRIRSIRIERAQIQPPKPTPDSFPVLYAGTNFDGPAEAIERDKAELADWDGSPHTIRSMRVPAGWYFVVYTERNFRGKSYNINSNMTFAPGDAWYNKIRSIKVYKGAPPKQPR